MTKDPQHELGEQEDHGDVSDHYFGRRETRKCDYCGKPRDNTHDALACSAEIDRIADANLEMQEAMLHSRAVTRYEWREQERHLSKSQLASAAIAVLILGTAICFAILLSFGGK